MPPLLLRFEVKIETFGKIGCGCFVYTSNHCVIPFNRHHSLFIFGLCTTLSIKSILKISFYGSQLSYL